MSAKRKIQRNMIISQELINISTPNGQQVYVNFYGPHLISKKVFNNRLYLSFKWDDSETSISIISRNANGYNYMDVGHHQRFFSSPEFMINEYGIPISVSDLTTLTVIDEDDFKTEFTAYGKSDLKELLDKLDNASNGKYGS